MIIEGERYKGASKLDERLESFRNEHTGEIELTDKEATRVLIETLLDIYEAQRTVDNQTVPMHPKIEALFEIARPHFEVPIGLPDIFKGEKINFTDVVEHIEQLRAERKAERPKVDNVITPPKPKQPAV